MIWKHLSFPVRWNSKTEFWEFFLHFLFIFLHISVEVGMLAAAMQLIMIQ